MALAESSRCFFFVDVQNLDNVEGLALDGPHVHQAPKRGAIRTHVALFQLETLHLLGVEQVDLLPRNLLEIGVGDVLEIELFEFFLGVFEHLAHRRVDLRELARKINGGHADGSVFHHRLNPLHTGLEFLVGLLFRCFHGQHFFRRRDFQRKWHEVAKYPHGADGNDGRDDFHQPFQTVHGMPDGNDGNDVRGAAGQDENGKSGKHWPELHIRALAQKINQQERDDVVGQCREGIAEQIGPEHFWFPKITMAVRHEV